MGIPGASQQIEGSEFLIQGEEGKMMLAREALRADGTLGVSVWDVEVGQNDRQQGRGQEMLGVGGSQERAFDKTEHV